jgi:hypothetical protein
MKFLSNVQIRNGGSITALGVLVAVALLIPASVTEGQGKAKGKTPAAADKAPDLAADIDDAIRVVETRDFKKFFERYAPVEALRALRQQDQLDQIAAMLPQDPEFVPRVLATLKALKKLKPEYDKSRGLATFEFDITALGLPETAAELRLPKAADVKLTGLGDDLSKVVDQATKLLEAGDISAFVQRLFPASEIARLQAEGQLQAVVQQFKDVPEIRESILADLKRIKAMKAELTEKGQIAVFKLPAEKDQPARTIKFQKASGGWRLFDDATRVSAELVRQSKLKSRGSVTRVQMELVGGNWRFVELAPPSFNLPEE